MVGLVHLDAAVNVGAAHPDVAASRTPSNKDSQLKKVGRPPWLVKASNETVTRSPTSENRAVFKTGAGA